MADTSVPGTPSSRGLLGRVLRQFRPLHEHSAYSATVLLMSTVLLSRGMGFLREIYIARTFGAGWQTDAYYAAFTIPDWLNYIAAGGTASITFISIYSKFLAEKREDEAQKTFSIILTVMGAILLVGIVGGEIFAPQLIHLMFRKFTPQQFDLCVFLTRVLFPAQAFFYAGGVVSAVLLARRLFLLPALGPLIYNGGIIAGGILFSRWLGISSLAYGAVGGAFVGIFLIQAIGAARIGAWYRPSFDTSNPAFRRWVKLSIPLMLGFSLVTVDDWFLRYFAGLGPVGDISRLNYAKRLFQVPVSILGQAAGQASYPFFARLFEEKRLQELSDTVNASVYRAVAASFLFASFMMSTALPLVDLAYRHGHFLAADARETAVYFFWFSISLAFWSAQALYTRAYYASGNTLNPMIASTVVMLASLPVYDILFRTHGAVGLTIASDIGIAANCLAMAVLVHRRRLVLAGELNWGELTKAGITAVLAGVLSHRVAARLMTGGGMLPDLKALSMAGLTWAAAVAAGLWITRSSLLQDLRRKRAAV